MTNLIEAIRKSNTRYVVIGVVSLNNTLCYHIQNINIRIGVMFLNSLESYRLSYGFYASN